MDKYLEAGKSLLGSLYRDDDPTCWMARFKDSTKLSEMTIPGTHDAAAYKYTTREPEWWNCQTTALFRQLEAGIRALDIRYALEDDKLLLVHAAETLDHTVQLIHVIFGLHEWLRLHPTETIIVSLKYDRPNDRHSERLREEKIKAVLDQTIPKGFWLDNVTTNSTLGDCRGKLVLFRRFELHRGPGFDVSHDWAGNHPGFSIPFASGGDARIEDFYLLQNHPGDTNHHIDEKWQATVKHLEAARDAIAKGTQSLWVTFSSAVGDKRETGEDVTPRVMALGRGSVSGINQRLVEWCQKNPDGHLGIILMDFVSVRRKEGGEDEEDTQLLRALIKRQALTT